MPAVTALALSGAAGRVWTGHAGGYMRVWGAASRNPICPLLRAFHSDVRRAPAPRRGAALPGGGTGVWAPRCGQARRRAPGWGGAAGRGCAGSGAGRGRRCSAAGSRPACNTGPWVLCDQTRGPPQRPSAARQPPSRPRLDSGCAARVCDETRDAGLTRAQVPVHGRVRRRLGGQRGGQCAARGAGADHAAGRRPKHAPAGPPPLRPGRQPRPRARPVPRAVGPAQAWAPFAGLAAQDGRRSVSQPDASHRAHFRLGHALRSRSGLSVRSSAPAHIGACGTRRSARRPAAPQRYADAHAQVCCTLRWPDGGGGLALGRLAAGVIGEGRRSMRKVPSPRPRGARRPPRGGAGPHCAGRLRPVGRARRARGKRPCIGRHAQRRIVTLCGL